MGNPQSETISSRSHKSSARLQRPRSEPLTLLDFLPFISDLRLSYLQCCPFIHDVSQPETLPFLSCADAVYKQTHWGCIMSSPIACMHHGTIGLEVTKRDSTSSEADKSS